jgi:hypothetical protein
MQQPGTIKSSIILYCGAATSTVSLSMYRDLYTAGCLNLLENSGLVKVSNWTAFTLHAI